MGVVMLLFLVSLAFTSGTSLMTIRPAQPKSTVIIPVYRHDASKIIYPWLRKGYVVEHVTSTNDAGDVLFVLIKY